MRQWISTTNAENNIARTGGLVGPGRHPGGGLTSFEAAATTLTLDGGVTSTEVTCRWLGRHATATEWPESGIGTTRCDLTISGTPVGQALGIAVTDFADESAVNAGTGAANQGRWRATTSTPDLTAGAGYLIRIIARPKTSTTANILGTCDTSGGNGYSIAYSSAALDFAQNSQTGTPGAKTLTSTANVTPDQYHEIVAMHNVSGAVMRWYVNGVFAGANTTAHTPTDLNNTGWWLGAGTSLTAASGSNIDIALVDIWTGITGFGASADILAGIEAIRISSYST